MLKSFFCFLEQFTFLHASVTKKLQGRTVVYSLSVLLLAILNPLYFSLASYSILACLHFLVCVYPTFLSEMNKRSSDLEPISGSVRFSTNKVRTQQAQSKSGGDR